MKTFNVIATGVLFTVAGLAISNQLKAADSANRDSTVVAEKTNEEELFDKLETSLLFGLSSDVSGVLESTLFNAVNFKVEYPEFASEKVERRLNEIAQEGDSHTLRYKAYLTLAYYKNPEKFDSPETLLTLLDYHHQNGIFFYLQDKVQAEQYTSNES